MGEFLDPAPSQAELDFWLFPDGQPHKVSRWPQFITPRSTARFMLPHQGDVAFVAGKWLVRVTLSQHDTPRPPLTLWATFDLQPQAAVNPGVGDTALQVGTVPERMIFSLLPSNNVFGTGQTGVIAEARISDLAGPPSFNYWVRAAWLENVTGFPWGVNSDTVPPDLVQFETDTFNGWRAGNMSIYGVSDCYGFPRLTPPLQALSFTGQPGQELRLTNLTTPVANRWQITAEVYLRSTDKAWLFSRSANDNEQTGVDNPGFRWRNSFVPVSGGWPLNQWFLFRAEREWLFPTGNQTRIFVDDVQRGSANIGNLSLSFDRVGWNGRPTWPVPDFDVRNLKLETGTPAAPNVRVDFPFLVNTCDVGPLQNHGIPFNVNLPPCP